MSCVRSRVEKIEIIFVLNENGMFLHFSISLIGEIVSTTFLLPSFSIFCSRFMTRTTSYSFETTNRKRKIVEFSWFSWKPQYDKSFLCWKKKQLFFFFLRFRVFSYILQYIYTVSCYTIPPYVNLWCNNNIRMHIA